MSAITMHPATDDDFVEMARFDGLRFGNTWSEQELAAVRPTLDLDRFRVARDGGAIVGVAGVYSQTLTLPGGAVTPAGGVTWVAVSPTHRRQGLLTALMDEMHADIDAHREPVAMLTASEGGIYERFGYGVATQFRVSEIDRRRTQVRPEFRPAAGDVALTEYDDERLIALFDRYRLGRVGEISRSADHFALVKVEQGPGLIAAVHADGFAAWKVTSKWNDGHPAHEMQLVDMVTITPEAHAALWHTVLSVDLVGPITSYGALAPDDTLPYIVTDPRAVRTTNLNDMMWVHVRDVSRSLAARTYGTDDAFVIEVDLDGVVGRWRVSGSPEGADVRKVRSRPDLSMERASLGAILLGGVRPSTLARGARVRASGAVLRRADAFFSGERLPHCMTGF